MRSARLFASARSKRILGATLVVLAVVFLGSAVLFSRYGAWLTDPFALREWIRGYGPFAPLVFVGLQAAQVILAPIPGQVLGLASGFLFGTFWGTVYSLIGATLGTIVAISVVGRIPGYVVVNATGAGLASDLVLESVTVLLVLLALSGLVVRYRDALLERLFATSQR